MMKEIGLSPAMVFGDRKTEAVFIGVGMDKPSMLQALEDALLTDAEFAEGEAGWKELEDVFFGGQFFDVILPPNEGDHDHKHGVDAGADLHKLF